MPKLCSLPPDNRPIIAAMDFLNGFAAPGNDARNQAAGAAPPLNNAGAYSLDFILGSGDDFGQFDSMDHTIAFDAAYNEPNGVTEVNTQMFTQEVFVCYGMVRVLRPISTCHCQRSH